MKGTDTQVKVSSELSVDDFNNYFITACDTQTTNLAHQSKSQQVDQPQSMFFASVTDDEILKFIARLINKKSVGIDGIDVRILKKAAKLLVHILKRLSINAFLKAFSLNV